MFSEIALCIAAFVSATLAAVIGLGGGMILISVVPIFLPADAIIPIHGVSQLASNLSRVAFSIRRVLWSLLLPFITGSLAGLAIAWALLSEIALSWLPVGIGLYIIVSVWLPNLQARLSGLANVYVIGGLQTGLGSVVGATGPLTTALLRKLSEDKDSIVSTNALFMSFTHAAKVALFASLGFAYADYWNILIWMIIGAILGSYVGTKIRAKIDNLHFLIILKWVLTVLALKMIIEVFIG